MSNEKQQPTQPESAPVGVLSDTSTYLEWKQRVAPGWSWWEEPLERRRTQTERLFRLRRPPDQFIFDIVPFDVLWPGRAGGTPEFVRRLADEYRERDAMVVPLEREEAFAIFTAGTPRQWIELQLTFRGYRQFICYDEWKDFNCHWWPTTMKEQDAASKRTQAMWASRPTPFWHVLRPPFYYALYSVRHDHQRHEEYVRRFLAERQALGDIVVADQVFAIGTPPLIIEWTQQWRKRWHGAWRSRVARESRLPSHREPVHRAGGF